MLENMTQIITAILSALITPIVLYAIDRLIQNRRFRESKIKGYHLSIRHIDSKNDAIIELIRIRRSHLFTIIGETVYYYKDQDYRLNLKFQKQHPSVISGTWKNKNDAYHFGEFAWNFDFATNKSAGFWSATTRNGLIEFGRWELIKLEKNIETVLINRLNNKKRTKERTSSLYDNILVRHDKEPVRPFSFYDKKYDIMKNVFNPQFGKIGRPLIEYFLKEYDLSKFKNILDWGTGCGYYCIEIALKQKESGTISQIFALESGEEAFQCATENMMKFSVAETITLINNSRISNIKPNTKFDLIIANMPFSKPCYLVKYKKHPMYNCFCAPPKLVLEICFEIKNVLSNNGIALLSYADSGDKALLFKCLGLLDLTARELFRIDEEHGATDDIFYAYEIKKRSKYEIKKEANMRSKKEANKGV
jgi:methylase of polypeptide subunit release factors